MSKFDNEIVTLEIPYQEALHWQDLILTFDDKCIKCQALLIHLTAGIKDAAKKHHNRIKRIEIKKHKYDPIEYNYPSTAKAPQREETNKLGRK